MLLIMLPKMSLKVSPSLALRGKLARISQTDFTLNKNE